MRIQSVVGPAAAKAAGKDIRKMMERKAMSKDFHYSEKRHLISKDNQILLSKLVEISSGKWSCLPPIKTAQKPAKKSSSASRIFAPQTLNLIVRKKEMARIEQENHAFAKRLFDQQPVLKKENFDDAYKDHCKFKK